MELFLNVGVIEGRELAFYGWRLRVGTVAIGSIGFL